MNEPPQKHSNIGSIDRRSALPLAAGRVLAATAMAQSSQLDGRRFEGVFLQRGKTSGDADTLLFQGGRFRSTACDRYGYSDAAYRVVAAGDAARPRLQRRTP